MTFLSTAPLSDDLPKTNKERKEHQFVSVYRAACTNLKQVPVKAACRFVEGTRELHLRHCHMNAEGARALAIALVVSF